jgi:PhnB protein
VDARGDRQRHAREHTGTATVTAPSEREIVITRTFDAPRTVVFDAWTKAEHVAQWWDPSRAPLTVCEIDLRPNGTFRFVNQGPDGAKHPFTGIYREITPPARLVFTTPSPSGAESVGTLVFSEHDGKTTLTMTIACESKADRDALLTMRVDVGTARTLDNLDQYLHARQEMNTMTMNTYVNFAGNCADAFRFYEKHLGATIGMMMTHAQNPDQSRVSPELKDAVLHGRLSIGGTELMGADIPGAEPMRSAYLSIRVGSDAEAERMFEALADAGQVFMPMQETFFASRFGQLRDRFGINWMILHERPRS